MYYFYDEQAARQLQANNEKKAVKSVGFVAGACVIGYVVIQNLLSILIYLSPIGELYQNDLTMQSVVSIFLSISGLLLPFALGGMYLSKKYNMQTVNFQKPVSIPLMLAAVPLGFFICLVGNYITSLFVTFTDSIGITLTAPDYNPPENPAGRLVYAVAIAVVPALVEEFAIRGVILQPLRRYGDKFAILASSVIFAVLHGNLIQAPFALIAGIGLGYAVCITNSVWTGVLIHFVNNLYSVFMEFMIADITDEEKLNTIYLAVMAALYLISIAGSVLFIIMKKNRKLLPSFTVITEGKKMSAFMLNITMIIALIIMLGITSTYVDFGI